MHPEMRGRCCSFLLLFSFFCLTQTVNTQNVPSDDNEEFVVLRKTLEDLTSTVHFQNRRIDALQRTVQRQSMRLRDEKYCKSCKVSDDEAAEVSTQRLQRKGRLLYQPTSPTSADENVVAFYAYYSADVGSFGLSETLKYDVVKTNAGNGYHPSSGVFIAPEEGFYVFTWTIRNYHYGDSTIENFSTELIINGDVYGSIFLRAHLEDDDQSSGTVVAHVNKGEDVYVRTHSSYASIGSIRSNVHGRSSFAGWKINC